MKKSTKELLELMKSCKDYSEYLSLNKHELHKEHMKVHIVLNNLLIEKNQIKSEVIFRSGIENHYAYQIFSGTKNPTRDKILMLFVGFGLSVEEAQRHLKSMGYAELYGKNERDNVIMFGLTKKLSIIEINELLYELNLELLN